MKSKSQIINKKLQTLATPANTWMFFCAAPNFVASNAERAFFLVVTDSFASLVDTIAHLWRSFRLRPGTAALFLGLWQTYPIHFTQSPRNFKLNVLNLIILRLIEQKSIVCQGVFPRIK
jgi:hypothetical protein